MCRILPLHLLSVCSDLAGPGDAEERRPEELPAVYED